MLADLLDLVYDHDELADLDAAERRLAIRELIADSGVGDVASAVERVADEIDGFGPISDLMRDGVTTDILINGPLEIWTDSGGKLSRTDRSFDSQDHLRSWCERHVALAGGRVDAALPISDVRLADGSRMHVVLPPLAPAGPLVSIRRFPRRFATLDELVAEDAMTEHDAALLSHAVDEGRSIVISGATGTGKTTLLGILLGLVPLCERVVVVEELPELPVGRQNQVSLTARVANAEGRGEITLENLVRASLRMRPDRIVVGEVRGVEALPALWAMSSGHRGSMLSVHASSAQDASRRLVDLALMAERAPGERTLERELERSVDLFVHLCRREGKRAVECILGPR